MAEALATLVGKLRNRGAISPKAGAELHEFASRLAAAAYTWAEECRHAAEIALFDDRYTAGSYSETNDLVEESDPPEDGRAASATTSTKGD
jgi:hypothetical protein